MTKPTTIKKKKRKKNKINYTKTTSSLVITEIIIPEAYALISFHHIINLFNIVSTYYCRIMTIYWNSSDTVWIVQMYKT